MQVSRSWAGSRCVLLTNEPISCLDRKKLASRRQIVRLPQPIEPLKVRRQSPQFTPQRKIRCRGRYSWWAFGGWASRRTWRGWPAVLFECGLCCEMSNDSTIHALSMFPERFERSCLSTDTSAC